MIDVSFEYCFLSIDYADGDSCGENADVTFSIRSMARISTFKKFRRATLWVLERLSE